MIIYTYVILFVLFLLNTSNKKNVGKKTIFVGFLLFLLMALKDYSVGTDTIRYLERYNQTGSIKDTMDEYEPGFYYLILYSKHLGLDYRLFSTFCYLVIYTFTTLFIYKFSKRPIFSFLLFITIGIFGFTTSGLRQALAISLCYFAIYLIIERKFILISSLVIILASTIHFSARIGFLFILLYFISIMIKKINRNLFIFLLLLPLVALYFNKYIVPYLLLLNESFRYEMYYDNDNSVNIISYFIIPYLEFLFASFLYFKTKNNDENKNKIYIFLYLCCFVYAMTAGLSIALPMTARFLYYFSLPTLVFITNSIERQKYSVKIKRFQFLALIIVSLMYFYITAPNNIMMYSDYKFFFLQ